jgi:hypothetical protein
MNEQKHEMVLEETHSSGAEEWYCPTCGRRMTITWEPWKKIVLEPGDVYAAHSAVKGGLQLGAVELRQGSQTDLPTTTESSMDDPYLEPWRRWLDKADLDDLWNKDIQ